MIAMLLRSLRERERERERYVTHITYFKHQQEDKVN